MLLQGIIDAIVQFILFSIIPFLWWFFTARKKEKLLSWIGLKKPVIKNIRMFILLSGIFMVSSVVSNFFFTVVERSETATGQFISTGAAALLSGIIYGMVTTGLTEEVLFRGFLAKRLIKLLGFKIGNIIQAALFGSLHLALFYLASDITVFQGFMVFLVPSFVGWVFGYINEKQADGSIVPSWLLHGIGNVFASVMMMFGLFNP